MSRHRGIRNLKYDDYGYEDDFPLGSPPSLPNASDNPYVYNRNGAGNQSSGFSHYMPTTDEYGNQLPSSQTTSSSAHDNVAHDAHYDDTIFQMDHEEYPAPQASHSPSASALPYGITPVKKSAKKKKKKKRTPANDKSHTASLLFGGGSIDTPKKHVVAVERPEQAASPWRQVRDVDEKAAPAKVISISGPSSAVTSASPSPVPLGLTPVVSPNVSTPSSPLERSKSPDTLRRIALRRQTTTEQRLEHAVNKRKKKIQSLLDEEKKLNQDKKGHLNMVVIGHVDAGKSTLMGHLLFLAGRVDKRVIRKYQKDSATAGKGSFAFAWVLDSHTEERSRGITVDVAVNYFETESKLITLLDAPGHRDFIPNMISGAAQADVAVLVVPAAKGEFESAFVSSGQTKEHAVLARSLGVGQLVVAVNKLDAVDWSEARYHEIVQQVGAFLKTAKYKPSAVRYVPVSGLTGENIKEAKAGGLLKWYKGPTLMELIDTYSLPQRHTEKPFRLCISDVFRSQTLGITVAGKVESGILLPKDKVLIMPQNEQVVVKGLESTTQPLKLAQAGQNVEIGLRDVADETSLAVGQFLCHPEAPIPLVTRFGAQIITLDIPVPIIKGQKVIMYTQSLREPAVVKKLVSLTNRSSAETMKKRPRAIPRNSSACVEIVVQRPICLELFASNRALGRFSLRRGPDTVAVGIVTSIVKQV